MEFVPPQCADDPTHNVIVTLPGVFQAAATGYTYTDSDASDESDWYGEVLLAWTEGTGWGKGGALTRYEAIAGANHFTALDSLARGATLEVNRDQTITGFKPRTLSTDPEPGSWSYSESGPRQSGWSLASKTAMPTSHV